MKAYVLEDEKEFDRLEFQSTLPKYDFKEEFKDIVLIPGQKILDAGCGSGLVLRHFASFFPQSSFYGCDFSSDRINKAKEKAKEFSNIDFSVQDLRQTSFSNDFFDVILNRYVLEHIAPSEVPDVCREFYRLLKPKGKIHLVDFDGPLFNIFPQTPLMKKYLEAAHKINIDLFVGRKIPAYLSWAGFSSIEWDIITVTCNKLYKVHEKFLWEDKLYFSKDALCQYVDDKSDFEFFVHEYLEMIGRPESTLFYNKFIVSAVK